MPNRVILPMIASGCVAINLIAAENPGETSIHEILRAQTEAWNRADGMAWQRNLLTTAILWIFEATLCTVAAKLEPTSWPACELG